MRRIRTRRIGIVGAALAALLMLGGCTSWGGGSTGDLGGGDGVVEPGAVGEEPGLDEGSADDGDRSVVVTGEVTLTTEDPIAASRQAVQIVEAAGGRIDGRSETGPTEFGPGSAYLELRIPAIAVDSLIEELRGIGRVDRVDTHVRDVTVETRDLDARISALEASIGRIQVLMSDATDIGDLIAIESELSSRQGELESLKAEQRYYADQVAMSTIWLELRATAAAANPAPDDFGEGLVLGWDSFVAFWAGLLVVLGVLVPWLVFAALIALVVVLLVQRRRRRTAGRVETAVPADSAAD